MLLLLNWHLNKLYNGKNTKPGEDDSLMQYAKHEHGRKTLAKVNLES